MTGWRQYSLATSQWTMRLVTICTNAGSLGPLRPHRPVVHAFRRIGDLLSRRFGLVRLFGVDAVVAGDQVWTVEVNPRYTASVEVLEHALGIAAVALHVQACRAGQLPAEPDRNRCIEASEDPFGSRSDSN